MAILYVLQFNSYQYIVTVLIVANMSCGGVSQISLKNCRAITNVTGQQQNIYRNTITTLDYSTSNVKMYIIPDSRKQLL
jgi:hypothetical protein